VLRADIRAGEKIPWRKYDPIELLVQQMRAGKQNRRIAATTEVANAVAQEIIGKLSALAADKIPLPQVQLAVKALAVTGAVVTVMDLAAQASLGLMPTKIVDLYTVVDKQDASKRRVKQRTVIEQKLPNPKVGIGVANRATVEVYITAASDEASLSHPVQIAGTLAAPLFLKWGKKGGSGGESTDPDWKSEGALQEYITEQLKRRLAGIPIFKDWAAQFNRPIKIKGYKTGPIAVTSDKVVTLKAEGLSDRLIELGEYENQPGHFYIQGRHRTAPGEEAGYFFGLKGWLIQELMTLDGRSTNLKGVVDVVPGHSAGGCRLGKKGDACYMDDDFAAAGSSGRVNSDAEDCECVRKVLGGKRNN